MHEALTRNNQIIPYRGCIQRRRPILASGFVMRVC